MVTKITMLDSSSTIRSRRLFGAIRRSPLAGLISLPYFLLRSSTAGGALIAGLIQTFVFARVLSPEQFSIFILVGTLGISMWLFDLGLPKILFVRLRARYLAGEDSEAIAGQADAVFVFYALLVISAAMLCFTILATRPSVSAVDAAQYALFFLFCALNLTWFVLRNLSIAVDEYIFFEALEALRRIGSVAAMLAMLVDLPLPVFLIVVNLLWVMLFAVSAARLRRRGALTLKVRGIASRLRLFFRENLQSAMRTGTHAACELYIHNALYLIVPLVFGLGAPTIILDTTFKVFFGSLVLYSAACDLLVPRQTRAFAEHDGPTLIRASLAAISLSAVPAIIIGAILLFDADRLFALLLGASATMPATATPIILLLLAAGVLKTAANSLLQNTGAFREISRLAMIVAATTTIVMIAGALAGLDMVGFLAVYAALYAGSALLYVWLAVRGPIELARRDQK